MKTYRYLAARYLSNIFVPPSFTFLSFLFLAINFENILLMKVAGIFNGLLYGLLIPIVIFQKLRKKGKVGDIDATVKEERFFPFIYGVVICCAALIISGLIGSHEYILVLWLLYIINTLGLILITKFWKISAHAIGISIPIGVFFYIYGTVSLYMLPLLLLICWSRLELKVHTTLQLLMGSIYGFGSTYLVFSVLLG
ncbi:MAG: hypothetical protein KJ799_05660 [Bacteroidetes bacterium]|nr:hypothetical protein [Bacteroidota bacterium]